MADDNIITFTIKSLFTSFNDKFDVEKDVKNINDQPTFFEALKGCVTTPTYSYKYGDINYDNFELYGDKTLQMMLVKYCFQTKKMVTCLKANNIITRLIIKYLSGVYLSNLCEEIGLSKYILFIPGDKILPSQIQEDVFEAWIGVCWYYLDENIVQRFVFKLFDFMDFKWDYESLIDTKTILNDVSSFMKIKVVKIGTWSEKNKSKNYLNSYYSIYEYNNISIIGYGPTKNISEINAAKLMLEWLKNNMADFDNAYVSTNSYLNWMKFIDSNHIISI